MKKNSFFSGFFWKFNEQISSQLVTFIVQIILARLLSPKDYGVIALVNVFIILADVFVSSGFSTSLIQKKDANDTDFSTIFFCSLFFSIVIYILAFICAPYIAYFYNNESLTLVIRIFAIRLPITAFNAIQQAYIARKMAFRMIFVSTTLASICSGILGILFAYLGYGVWALVFQYLLNAIFSALVLFIQIPWQPKLIFSFSSAKSLMSFGWKVMAADFLGTFFNQLRTLIIGRFYSSSSLAFYNRGMQFPTLISNNVDTTISSVLFPYMSQNAKNKNELKVIVRKSLRTSTYLIMPLMVGLAIIAKPLILIILTKKWLPAVPFMQCLSIASAFTTITNTNLQAMKASGRSDVLLRIEFIKKPIYLILLIIGIKISLYFVAVTMIIYSIYATLVNMGPNVKILNYKYKEQIGDILPAVFISCLMGIIIWPISLFEIAPIFVLLLQIVLGIGMYIGFSRLFRVDAYMFLLKSMKEKLKK